MWMVDPGAERALRDLADRGDIIKTMHRAMQRGGMAFDTSALALHRETPGDPIVGRLVARGLDDELAGSAFAIVDGVDGRTHHIRFDDIEWTGDVKPGAIVELRSWEGRGRSEEHTSELQSLMRISYAVFCLKKKKTNNTYQN